MVKFIIIGVWVCLVALGSSYGVAYWAAGVAHAKSDEYMAGLEYRRVPPITVPMIIDGNVKGYVIAKLVFTADATTLHKLPLDPVIFVTDAAFNEIYVNGKVESGKMSRYNLPEMLQRIKVSVNKYMNGDIIQDVLVDAVNYIDKTDMRGGRGDNTPIKTSEPKPAAKAAH